MWIEWTIATRFLREGKSQSTLILVGIAVGVAVIVFLTALITGLQGNIVNRTLGTQAHIKVQPTEETNRILPPADGAVQLVLENKRAQRLRSSLICVVYPSMPPRACRRQSLRANSRCSAA